jgi:hypothetical protein
MSYGRSSVMQAYRKLTENPQGAHKIGQRLLYYSARERG